MSLLRKIFRTGGSALVAAMLLAGTAGAGAAQARTVGSGSVRAGSSTDSTSSTGVIDNDSFWTDTSGDLIASQGGGVFRFGNTYYWYGVHYEAADPYAASPTKIYSTAVFSSIDVYSSKNLSDWTFRNRVATPSTALDIPTSKDVTGTAFSAMTSLADASWLGRMGVVYNENTGKYVLIIQMRTSLDSDGTTNNSTLFLSSDTPTGDFTYANLQTQITNVLYQGTGDQTVFTDDDGSDYLVLSNQKGRANQYVARISPEDSLSIEPATWVSYNGSGREGNAMFKANGHYYIASSDLHGWNSSATHIVESTTDDIQGSYGAEYVLSGSEDDYSHVSQTGFFFTVAGTKTDTVVFAGDRWAEFAWNGTGYNQWMPLSFDADTPVLNSLSSWRLNARTGRWNTTRDNNYLLNPDFEADRVSVTEVTGWDTVVADDSPTEDLVTNPTPAGNGTRHAVSLGNEDGFSGGIEQTVTVPAGRYTLALSARAEEGLETATVRITDSRGRSSTLDLLDAVGTGTAWTTASRSGIKLAAGEVTVSVEASAATDATLRVDGLSLTRS